MAVKELRHHIDDCGIESGRERCNGEAGNEFAESIKKTWRGNTWT